MQIQVLLFGITRDIIGKGVIDLNVSESTSVYDLKKQLMLKHKKLNTYNFSVAVNETYVEEDQVLKDNDIVALIPPVSGG